MVATEELAATVAVATGVTAGTAPPPPAMVVMGATVASTAPAAAGTGATAVISPRTRTPGMRATAGMVVTVPAPGKAAREARDRNGKRLVKMAPRARRSGASAASRIPPSVPMMRPSRTTPSLARWTPNCSPDTGTTTCRPLHMTGTSLKPGSMHRALLKSKASSIPTVSTPSAFAPSSSSRSTAPTR